MSDEEVEPERATKLPALKSDTSEMITSVFKSVPPSSDINIVPARADINRFHE